LCFPQCCPAQSPPATSPSVASTAAHGPDHMGLVCWGGWRGWYAVPCRRDIWIWLGISCCDQCGLYGDSAYDGPVVFPSALSIAHTNRATHPNKQGPCGQAHAPQWKRRLARLQGGFGRDSIGGNTNYIFTADAICNGTGAPKGDLVGCVRPLE